MAESNVLDILIKADEYVRRGLWVQVLRLEPQARRAFVRGRLREAK